ncbi:MAG: 2-oxoacid:acceptor oxidoreductase family protein [candidate division WOR-3 bacterium]|jgi:2-oxoglutarate ferredoxin oxidoreductase subunit gamma|nr:2-oxoacid:acceptor oxidoreductase family protein [candidate division WOR-3 bacterium]MCR4423253.1 2-oxoacid:acceptor oxidoreductase family protein [candidate division WOR-3 bacterium]MDH7518592.1 2-oxoacid:acceptor oxidoreductase family protein [bacterium]
MQVEIVFAGFGGQGVMLAGKVLAEVGMKMGKEVVWLPSYGPEMRGGTANCTVIIADEPIASPIIAHPRDTVVMNRPSLEKFCPTQKPGGVAVVNSSLINIRPNRDDILIVEVPANEIAIQAGSSRSANMVMLGAYAGATKIVPLNMVLEQVKEEFEKRPKLIPVNLKCVEQGFNIGSAAAVR